LGRVEKVLKAVIAIPPKAGEAISFYTSMSWRLLRRPYGLLAMTLKGFFITTLGESQKVGSFSRRAGSPGQVVSGPAKAGHSSKPLPNLSFS